MPAQNKKVELTPGEWVYEPGERGCPPTRLEPGEPDIPPTVFARVNVDGTDYEVPICTLDSPVYQIEVPAAADEFEDGLRECGDIAANGHVLAASKDLLKACTAMLEMYNALCDKVDWGKAFLDAATIRKMNEAPGLAELAIAKATGEANA